MGRGGLYYRQSLTPGRPHYAPSTPQPAPLQSIPTADHQEIKSSSAASLTDSSAVELLKELNRVKKRRDRFRVVVIVGGAALILLFSVGVAVRISGLWALAITLLGVYARHSDVVNGTAVLNYSLEPDAENEYSKLQAPFRQLAQCQRYGTLMLLNATRTRNITQVRLWGWRGRKHTHSSQSHQRFNAISTCPYYRQKMYRSISSPTVCSFTTLEVSAQSRIAT
jgi:hypothetical protein